MGRKKWRRKGSHSSSVSGSNRLVTSNLEKSDGLVHCPVKNAAVLCENHRESRKFEVARLKKKKEKHIGIW